MRGLRISKPGFDATTAEEKDRVYDSNFNTFKYVRYGIITNATGSTTYTIPHRLGYAPSFIVYGRRVSGDDYVIVDVTLDGEGVTMQSDKTNIYIVVASAPPTQDLVYLIGADDLDDIAS